jgi:GT2 family glycosyltransferase
MVTLAVSILNYNSSEATLRCVRSLLAQPERADQRYALIIRVADNGSTEEDRRALQAALGDLPDVTLSWHGRNLGFAAGHNQNLSTMLGALRPDYVWLLNNDCVVEPGCISALLRCAQGEAGVGIWGATLLDADGETIQCAGGCSYNSWLSSFRQLGQGEPAAGSSSLQAGRFDYIAGASLFLPFETVTNGLRAARKLSANQTGDEHELLNEEFFLYYEELDLARRLKPGLAMRWCRGARIVHAGGRATGAAGGKRSAKAEYHSTLSALKFTRLYYPRRLWFMMPARFLAKFTQLGLTGHFALVGEVGRAYRDFCRWWASARMKAKGINGGGA